MTVRSDLLEAAAADAAMAKAAEGPVVRREHALAAKTALEAAHLAHDIPPDEIAQALDQMTSLLSGVGLDHQWRQMEPGQFLEVMVTHLAHWHDQAGQVQAIAAAYSRLRTLADGLERDFDAGATETSLRLAARVHVAIEEAERMLGRTGQEVSDG